jgi:hypothetical protein
LDGAAPRVRVWHDHTTGVSLLFADLPAREWPGRESAAVDALHALVARLMVRQLEDSLTRPAVDASQADGRQG